MRLVNYISSVLLVLTHQILEVSSKNIDCKFTDASAFSRWFFEKWLPCGFNRFKWPILPVDHSGRRRGESDTSLQSQTFKICCQGCCIPWQNLPNRDKEPDAEPYLEPNLHTVSQNVYRLPMSLMKCALLNTFFPTLVNLNMLPELASILRCGEEKTENFNLPAIFFCLHSFYYFHYNRCIFLFQG